ncbi:hypothetical protein ACQ4PT_063840 [Festuca glaucescens]
MTVEGDQGDPAIRRRRRLTIAPPASRLGASSSSPEGSRFVCLREVVEESEEDFDGELPHVAVQIAEEAIEDYPSQVWMPVVRRPQKSDKELLAEFWANDEFWADAGFPSPSSRFWERQSPHGKSSQGMSTDISSERRLSRSSTIPAVTLRSSGSSPVGSGRQSSSASPTGLCLSWAPRMGSWRGPLPPWRTTPTPVFRQFLDLTTSKLSASRQSATPASSPATGSTVEKELEPPVVFESAWITDLTSITERGPRLHVEDPGRSFGWDHLRRRMRRFFFAVDELVDTTSYAGRDIVFGSVAAPAVAFLHRRGGHDAAAADGWRPTAPFVGDGQLGHVGPSSPYSAGYYSDDDRFLAGAISWADASSTQQLVVAITPYNPNPRTPRGVEIVARIRGLSPGLLRPCAAAPLSAIAAVTLPGMVLVEDALVATPPLGAASLHGLVPSSPVEARSRSAPSSPMEACFRTATCATEVACDSVVISAPGVAHSSVVPSAEVARDNAVISAPSVARSSAF